MHHHRMPSLLLMLVIAMTCSCVLPSGSAVASEQEIFFESQVRPLLIAHCVECHGGDEQAGELRLDRKSAVQRGGGSGPVIIAGDPGNSPLIRAIGYSDTSLQMPPEGKLAEEQIAVLTKWVEAGAFWPDDADPENNQPISPAERIDELRESHWAYRSLQTTTPPAAWQDTSPELADWPKQTLDHFVLSKLHDAGLRPSPKADRRTLIHRAHFSLIGLPPSYEEVEAFVADDSPDAFEKLVDRLLDNRHYGERWARHWLDIARYADTTGYMAGSRETRYPYAFTYRDYVIDAFNDDKPFDRFIIEQLAADQLDLPSEDRSALAAMGFLTVGRRFMGRQHDIIDDRIDVVTRGFLATTVTCARCHDHKFDPVPAADYYSLYGVFASSNEPDDLPLLGEPQPSPQYDEFLAEQAKKQKEVDDWVEERRVHTEHELRSRVADYLVYLAKTLPPHDAKGVSRQGARGALRPQAVTRWQNYLAKPPSEPHPVWTLWHQLASFEPEQFAEKAAELLAEPASDAEQPADAQQQDKDPPRATEVTDPQLLSVLRANPPATMVDAAQQIGDALEASYAAKDDQASAEDCLREALFAADSPTSLDAAQMINHLDQGERNTHNSKLSQVKAVEVSHPGAPPRAMVMYDKPTPYEPVVFRRGQPGNRGDRVPRRFLQVLSHVDGGEPFRQGSGRLELAQAIASEHNPLTARVIVNRVWQQQFGAGLVRTASDFGTRGEAPTHPELLDHLAAEFIADGWSIKRLQRRLMLSATWQQDSSMRDEAHRVDPENRLLWHMPRRRMEFEPLRDRLLVASGQLDSQIGGRSVLIHEDSPRRGLYAYIDREDVPGLLASFDLPSPDASQAMRAQTTVPQQALFFMNSAFVIRQATALVEQVSELPSDSQRVQMLYRHSLARNPDDEELKLALQFVETSPQESQDSADSQPEVAGRWTQLAQVLLLCNEFAFVD